MSNTRRVLTLGVLLVLASVAPAPAAGADAPGGAGCPGTVSTRFYKLPTGRNRVVPGKPMVVHVLQNADCAPPVGLAVLVRTDSERGRDNKPTTVLRYRALPHSVLARAPEGTHDLSGSLTIEAPTWDHVLDAWHAPLASVDAFTGHPATLCLLGQGARIPTGGERDVAVTDGATPCQRVADALGGSAPPAVLAQFDVTIADPRAGQWMAVLVLLLGTALVGLGLRPFAWGGHDGVRRYARALLSILVDDTGHYSLSQLQMAIWTYVVSFSLVYVWAIELRFIEVPMQMVALLGIGAGTITARKLAFKDQRTTRHAPSLVDLISIDDRPHIARVQMLVFTTLIAAFVVLEVHDLHRFPELSEGLLWLMGVSSGYYVLGQYVPKSGEDDGRGKKDQATEPGAQGQG